MPSYNVQAALDEVMADFNAALPMTNILYKAPYVVAAITKACDDSHRAIFLAAPTLETVFDAALKSIAVDVAAHQADYSTCATLEDLIEYAHGRLTYATQNLEDVGATFVAYRDGQLYSAELCENHALATSVVAAKLVPSEAVRLFDNLGAWTTMFGLDMRTVIANYVCDGDEDEDEEQDSY